MNSDRNVLVREYRTAWEYARDVQDRLADGWRVVSTLERRPQRDWLHYLTFGLADLLRGPEHLVSFERAVAAPALPAPIVQSELRPAPLFPAPTPLALAFQRVSPVASLAALAQSRIAVAAGHGSLAA